MVFSKVRETGSLLNSKYGIILYLVKSVYVQERIQTGKKQEKNLFTPECYKWLPLSGITGVLLEYIHPLKVLFSNFTSIESLCNEKKPHYLLRDIPTAHSNRNQEFI